MKTYTGDFFVRRGQNFLSEEGRILVFVRKYERRERWEVMWGSEENCEICEWDRRKKRENGREMVEKCENGRWCENFHYEQLTWTDSTWYYGNLF